LLTLVNNIKWVASAPLCCSSPFQCCSVQIHCLLIQILLSHSSKAIWIVFPFKVTFDDWVGIFLYIKRKLGRDVVGCSIFCMLLGNSIVGQQRQGIHSCDLVEVAILGVFLEYKTKWKWNERCEKLGCDFQNGLIRTENKNTSYHFLPNF